VSEPFAFIGAQEADPTRCCPVTMMCQLLEVSTSGFYDWCSAAISPRARRRASVSTHVHAAFKDGRGAYGVRRVHAVLARSTDPQVASVSLHDGSPWDLTGYTSNGKPLARRRLRKRVHRARERFTRQRHHTQPLTNRCQRVAGWRADGTRRLADWAGAEGAMPLRRICQNRMARSSVVSTPPASYH